MFCTLLVEDSESFRSALGGMLRKNFPDMRVEEAESGLEALRKVDRLCPDLVFMDIKLPGDNGVRLTKNIKAGYAGVIVVILTSYDIPEYRQAAFRNGADCFISKDSATCMDDVLARVEGTLSAKGVVLN